MRRALVLASALFVLLVPGDLRAQETPRPGGVLRVATVGEPPTLDIQMSTTVLTYEIMWHVFESLLTYDRAFNPIPLLAESHDVDDRGLRHTITLPRGVRFHRGKEMTAADVVPSIKRWGQVASLGRILWKGVESIEAKDSYTVVLHLRQPKEFVGTGPYRFVEHRPDRHIKLVRFKDYAARAEPPNGFGGKRTAWLDEILFIPVPDAAVRLAGVEAGDFHHGLFIGQDAFVAPSDARGSGS